MSVPDELCSVQALVRASAPRAIVSEHTRHFGRHIYASTRHAKEWFVVLAEACAYVGDTDTTTQILSHFARSVLDAETAPWFETLVDVFGIDWFRDLWSRFGKWGDTFDLTPALVTRLDVGMLATILDTCEVTTRTFDTVHTVLRAYLKVRGEPVVPQKWIRVMDEWSRDTPSFPVLEWARFLERYSHMEGLDKVKELVLRALDTEGVEPPGWSLDVAEADCPCDACSRIYQFLRSKDRVKLEWQMSVRQRSHVLTRWQKRCATLPLEWHVKRCVRPFAWVLVKQWWLPNEWPKHQHHLACVQAQKTLNNSN